MISRNPECIKRFQQEKKQLEELIVKMKQSNISELDWIKHSIKIYSKRAKRIQELLDQAKEWQMNPLCIVTDQVLGRIKNEDMDKKVV